MEITKEDITKTLSVLSKGLPLDPLPDLETGYDVTVAHAPCHTPNLDAADKRLCLKNALRYFPATLHECLVHEFAHELRKYGHIYMYRFRPRFAIRAYPIECYPAKCAKAAAIMLMITNNLDPMVAQFPHELVTYGGNGQVFGNWAQFWLVMKYLSEINDEQTLVMYSGHPLGLFPSSKESPRAVITNGMVIPNYSSQADYERLFALGVTQYGQMTAGSYCYIGPQGIVHGTTLTILNAGRKFLCSNNGKYNSNDDNMLNGKVFVTSGLGGMSGAQAKAAVISGCIGVIAEVSLEALNKRFKQGWLKEKAQSLDDVIEKIRLYRKQKPAITTSIGYHGNVVDLWERLVIEYEKTGELLVDFGTDQTSCHNAYQGGYYPVDVDYEEARLIMHANPVRFQQLVQESLKRHIKAINLLHCKGMYFFDYGNSFLLQAAKCGADVYTTLPTSCTSNSARRENRFRYPSYVQDIMGDIFSMGFGPFRWVCTSGLPIDLATTDKIAEQILVKLSNSSSENGFPTAVTQQYHDNIKWIREAQENQLVVGSQARILYADEIGRVNIAKSFNEAVKDGRLNGPVVISRDHHDVSGTDSPFRETSNIEDGSAFCADMAVHNCIGDSFRGATWVALHNGGGVGWGEVINGGFGMLLDGSSEATKNAESMLSWDVVNGVARRSWSGNSLANNTIIRSMNASNGQLKVTMPEAVLDERILDEALK